MNITNQVHDQLKKKIIDSDFAVGGKINIDIAKKSIVNPDNKYYTQVSNHELSKARYDQDFFQKHGCTMEEYVKRMHDRGEEA